MASYTLKTVFLADTRDFQRTITQAINSIDKVDKAFKSGNFEAVGKIDVNSSGARAGIKEFETELKSINGAHAEVGVGASTQSATGELSAVANYVGQLNGAKATVSAEASAMGAIDPINQVDGKVSALNGRTAEVKLIADASGALSAIDKTSEAMEKSGGFTDSFKGKLSGLAGQFNLTESAGYAFGNICGNFITSGISMAISAVGNFCSSVIEVGSSFSSSMSELQAISGLDASIEEDSQALQRLEETAKHFGATTQFSASESADALKYMALAGWDADKSIEQLPGVLSLAASSGMDLASASDMVTDYMSAFGNSFADASKDAEYFSDVLAKTQSASNTTAQELGEAYRNCASTLNNYGQSVETTTALLGAMANEGEKGSTAGTKLNAIMRDIVNSMDNGAIAIGNTAVAVADEQGNFRDLADIIRDVNNVTKDMADTERASALSSAFTSDSMAGLTTIMSELNTTNVDGVDKLTALQKELANATGCAQEMADVVNDNLEGDLKSLGSAMDTFKIEIFQSMEQPMRGIVQVATGMFSGVTTAFTNVKTFLSSCGIGETVSGIFGGITTTLDGIKTSLGETFGQAWENIRPFFEKLGETFFELSEKLEPFIEAVSNAFNNLIIPTIEGFISWLLPVISSIWTATAPVFDAIGSALGVVIDIATGFMQMLQGDFVGAWESFGNAGQGVFDTLSGLLSGILDIGWSIVEGLWEGISSGWDWLWGKLSEWAGNIIDGIKGFFGIHSPAECTQEMGEELDNGLEVGMENNKPSLDTSIGKICGDIAGFFRNAWPGVTSVVDGLWNSLFGGGKKESSSETSMAVNIDMSGAVDSVNSAMTEITSAIEGKFITISSTVQTGTDGICVGFGQGLIGMKDVAILTMDETISGMTAKASAMSASFSSVFASIVTGASNQVQSLYTSSIDILTNLSTSAKSVVTGMADTITNVFVTIQKQTVSIATAMNVQIIAVVNSMTETYLNAIYQFSRSVLSSFELMRANIVTSIRQTSSQVISVTFDMVNQVRGAMSGLPSWCLSLGSSMMTQLSRGITSNMTTVLSATSSLVTQLIATFKTGLGIHSPSTELEWIGSMMVAGLIKGLSKDEILRFTAKYVDDMKASFMNGNIRIGTMIKAIDKNGAEGLIDYLGRNGDSGTLEAIASTVAGTSFPLPGSLSDWSISSYFGYRNDTGGVGSTNHQGIDIAGSGINGQPIYAISDGTVTIAGWYGGYGNAVEIDHGGGTQSIYGHMSAVATNAGANVKAGDLIGYVGSTGNSTGPHLHLSVIENGKMIDPLPIIQGASSLGGMTTTQLTLSKAIQNALTLLNSGRSYDEIDAMGSKVMARVTTSNESEARSAITTALNILGMYSDENLAKLMNLAYGESGYNSSIDQQIVDINTILGTPAKGLMQVIQPTFDAYKLPGYDDIYDAVANTLASIRYQLAVYGGLVSSAGYAVGSSFIPEDMIAMLHKGEVVLPVSDVERLQELTHPTNPYQNSHGNILDTVLNLPGSQAGASGLLDANLMRQDQGKQDLYITVVSELDGRIVGKSTARYIESENEWRESRMERLKGVR